MLFNPIIITLITLVLGFIIPIWLFIIMIIFNVLWLFLLIYARRNIPKANQKFIKGYKVSMKTITGVEWMDYYTVGIVKRSDKKLTQIIANNTLYIGYTINTKYIEED